MMKKKRPLLGILLFIIMLENFNSEWNRTLNWLQKLNLTNR